MYNFFCFWYPCLTDVYLTAAIRRLDKKDNCFISVTQIQQVWSWKQACHFSFLSVDSDKVVLVLKETSGLCFCLWLLLFIEVAACYQGRVVWGPPEEWSLVVSDPWRWHTWDIKACFFSSSSESSASISLSLLYFLNSSGTISHHCSEKMCFSSDLGVTSHQDCACVSGLHIEVWSQCLNWYH